VGEESQSSIARALTSNQRMQPTGRNRAGLPPAELASGAIKGSLGLCGRWHVGPQLMRIALGSGTYVEDFMRMRNVAHTGRRSLAFISMTARAITWLGAELPPIVLAQDGSVQRFAGGLSLTIEVARSAYSTDDSVNVRLTLRNNSQRRSCFRQFLPLASHGCASTIQRGGRSGPARGTRVSYSRLAS
jgi:hypothetical protein